MWKAMRLALRSRVSRRASTGNSMPGNFTGSPEAAAIVSTRSLKPGDPHYRAYVGPPGQYDFMGATQFRLLTSLGLREEHRLLDIGCGSLRAGRLFLQYLLPGRYHGVEPNSWLWREAIEKEIGPCVLDYKAPQFFEDDSFEFVFADDGYYDSILAQSIFSHTGMDLFEKGIASIARILSPAGQALFTVIGPKSTTKVPPWARETQGWRYPGCTIFDEAEVREVVQRHAMHAQRLPWFHPRQVWFRCVKDEHRLLPEPETAFRNGRVWFDERFDRVWSEPLGADSLAE